MADIPFAMYITRAVCQSATRFRTRVVRMRAGFFSLKCGRRARRVLSLVQTFDNRDRHVVVMSFGRQ